MSQQTKAAPVRAGRGRGHGQSDTAVHGAAEQRSARNRRQVGDLVVGGRPRVDLLPPEVLAARRAQRTVRRVWAGVVLVAAVVGIGIGAASMVAAGAHDDLTGAQSQTLSLLQQQAQYKDVRAAESGTALREAAQAVGGSTEISWKSYLGSVQESLPSGTRITGVTVDSASPFESYVQSDAPLQGRRIATLTIAAESPTLPSVPQWLDSLKGLTGFVDATANSVTLDESTGAYTVNMTIHVDDEAFDRKYDQDKGQ
ncbi:hypothetical protein [Curtobacterium luteum]|uniref:hypothetical protein n=1 Tax=Curtobacterium luteum TaxID=33881 RepID=UPI0007371715|nr:hypothetical protein [Curtobacterium luteum]